MESCTHRLPRAGVAGLLCLLAAAPALADDAGDRFTAEIGGRVHLDFAAFDNDDRGAPNADGSEFRRVWLDVSGKLLGLGYKIEGDFAGLQDDFHSGGIEAKDVYVTRDFAAGKLTVGQFKQYFSLDDRTSSNYGSFMERGFAAATLAPLYRLGAFWQAAPGDMTWAVSAYSLESIDNWRSKGSAFGGRATWAPSPAIGDVLHLGVSLAHEAYDSPGANGHDALRLRPRPAGHLADASRMTLVEFSAGRDTDVDKWSLEYAQVRGAWSWQGELSGARFDDGAQRGEVRAAYGFVSWFVTGESRRYDRRTGRFGRIADIGHPMGAFELALRYDRIDGRQHPIGQADLRDVRMAGWTLGGNWYLRPNLRLMLDVIESRNRDQRIGVTTDRTRAVTGRVHYDF